MEDKDVVIQIDKLKDFEKCDDYFTVEYSKKYNKFYEDEMCYFHKKLEIFILLSRNLTDEYDDQAFEE